MAKQAWQREQLEDVSEWWAHFPGVVPCKCDPVAATHAKLEVGDHSGEPTEGCGHPHCPFYEGCQPLGLCLPQCSNVTGIGEDYCHCPCH